MTDLYWNILVRYFRIWIIAKKSGKQEFRRTDFGSRLLAAEGEWEKGQWGWGVRLKWSNILLVVARTPQLKLLRRNSCYAEESPGEWM
jgi:hypothetical protein